VADAANIVERGIAVIPEAGQKNGNLIFLVFFQQKARNCFWQKYLADSSKNAIGLINGALAFAVTKGNSGR